ncbi:MAG: IS3 family transposase, partial [Acidobacteriota bacterium]|nr:IS3 family transposase [Acidobacteriota bacterium]
MKYAFILGHPEHPVARWAERLQIERTGYYAWLKCRDERLERLERLRRRIREEFDRSRGTYGPDRVAAELRKAGEKVGRRRCAAEMAGMGLKSIHRRQRARSLTDSRKARGDEGRPNILRAEGVPSVPRTALAGDITYLKTGEGFVYYCAVRDLATGEVLGDSMSDRMTAELAVDAMRAAVSRHRLAEGCVFHSDRGSQYTSEAYRGLLSRSGVRQSFSRVGMPGDNAWSESFFATLKKELTHWRHYETRESVR